MLERTGCNEVAAFVSCVTKKHKSSNSLDAFDYKLNFKFLVSYPAKFLATGWWLVLRANVKAGPPKTGGPEPLALSWSRWAAWGARVAARGCFVNGGSYLALVAGAELELVDLLTGLR